MKKSFTDPARLFLGGSLKEDAAAVPEELTPTGKKRMQIIVSASTYERLRAAAYENRESMNEIINRAIERELNK